MYDQRRTAFRRSRQSALALLALLAAPGCYATFPIQTPQLARFTGQPPAEEPLRGATVVLTPANDKLFVDPETTLLLDLPQGTAATTFGEIQVRDGVLHATTNHGTIVEAPLGSVRAARIRKTNVPAMVLLVTVAVVAAAIGGLLLFHPTSHAEAVRAP